MKKEIGELAELAERLDPDFVEVESFGQILVRHARKGRIRPGPSWSLTSGRSSAARLLHDVFAVHPLELLDVELGLDVVHRSNVEDPGRFGERQDLGPVGRRPAEEDEIIGQRLGQKALVPVFRDRNAAVALGELRPVRPQDQRHMAEARRGQAERFIKKDLLGRVRDVVVAAEDMGDARGRSRPRRRRNCRPASRRI